VRVVADTNTVLSAFLWGGPPKQVLDAARERRIQLLASAALLAELEDVLTRPKFAARIAQIDSVPATLLRQYRALIGIVRPTVITPTSRDPDDDQVLACALAAGAEIIVSRDKDLLTLSPFEGIPILTAHEALERFPGRKA
jgi:putative PIN family toxin of toxin-antitoxin system